MASQSFRVALIGPWNANYYKTGSRISKHQFQRYLKTGTDLKVAVLHRFPGHTSLDALPLVPQPAGEGTNEGLDYWESVHAACCEAKSGNNIRQGEDAPWHLSAPAASA